MFDFMVQRIGIDQMKRRDFLTVPAVAASVSVISSAAEAAQQKSRVRQSVMGWCFKPMEPIALAKQAKLIGLEALEGIPASSYPEVVALGLKISLVGSHGFANGPLDPTNHSEVEAKLREGIDLAVKYNAPNVITFTGMQKSGISDEMAKKNCLASWKRVIGYAEEKGIGIVLEHLNSKDDSHPMKGHPGYWGDDLHRCADLVRAMDSPNFKLLFDLYHVQIMHGDLIRNIRQYQSIIGHYHTAGNPGRGELNDQQEINYPPVIRAIVATGYQGFIAQEFIPTSDDPMRSLREAYTVCDV